MNCHLKHIFLYTLMALFLVSLTAVAESQVAKPTTISIRAKMQTQFSSGDWILQAEALDYAGRNKVIAFQPLVKKILAQKQGPWIRGRAFKALVEMLPEQAGQLAKTYMKDPHAPVKIAVAQQCAKLPARTADPIIKELLKQKGAVYYYALATYAKHHREKAWKKAATLDKIPSNCIEPVVRAWALIGNEGALTKITTLVKKKKSLTSILRGLKGVNNPAIISVYFDLVNASKGKIPIIEIWQALKLHKRDKLMAAFNKTFTSGNTAHLKVVAQIMSRYLQDPKLSDALQDALAKTNDVQTLFAGLSALSVTDPDRFKEFFISNLKHEKIEIRSFAVICLGQCKTVNLYEVLQQSLNDPESRVRIAVLDSLKIADSEKIATKKVAGYFKDSLLSKDKLTRAAAITAISPLINTENGEEIFAVMEQMLELYGITGISPLMKAIFRMIPQGKSILALEKLGYVAHWHVIGTFPTSVSMPRKGLKGMEVVYPPEKNVDLKQTIKVKYNSERDSRRAKKSVERETTWVKAITANEDAVLYMTKAGRSQLLMPNKHSICYAYTEIIISKKSVVNFEFLMATNVVEKVWLNGKLISLKSVTNKKQNTATKTVKVTLAPGRNKILVKIESNDQTQAWWAQKTSTRAFSLSIRDQQGKPLKWSHK